MRILKELHLGCLVVLLIAATVGVAIWWIALPELEQGALNRGHTLGEYFDRLLTR